MAEYTGTEVGQAIYAALAADPAISAALPTYEGNPAIWTLSDDAPGDAPYPRVVSPPETEQTRRLSLDQPPLRAATRLVNIWAENDGDGTALAQLSERVARVLGTPGAVALGAGFHTAWAQVAGPVGLGVESDEVLGRAVTVTVSFQEIP